MPLHIERPAPDGTTRLCYRLAMKKRAPFYPCLGYCIIDATGTCVAWRMAASPLPFSTS